MFTLPTCNFSRHQIQTTHDQNTDDILWNENKSGNILEKLELLECLKSVSNNETESNPEMKAVEVTDIRRTSLTVNFKMSLKNIILHSFYTITQLLSTQLMTSRWWNERSPQ
ncbi:hypothetical protein BLNAU_11753 [Blattamonas nauphoetae]|uniref:Uncharacterized protein n=1 Tax=Blattamonas nauphoetae TaxID=2049346 RepID=A0ABQ9XS89_9EUKA|nr:hypothetical protein BLNAU_11753 [Blattamonas nauphoetae]